MKRSTSFNIKRPTKEDRDWKPKKTKDPGVGAYEVPKSLSFVMTRNPQFSVPKSKQLKFTVEYSNQKKHIPGTGNYKIEKCFDHIARPYIKKRY